MRQFQSKHFVGLISPFQGHLVRGMNGAIPALGIIIPIPEQPATPGSDQLAHFNHIPRKTLFISVMKEIAKNLEKTMLDFLAADLFTKDWNYKAGPDKWTKKEIIGHLIDSAQINLQRFVRSTYTENFKLTYDQVQWVDAQQYIKADIAELLDLWRLLNRQIIRVLQNYPTERLQVNSDTGKTTTCFQTVEHLAQDYVNHLNHHLRAIELV
jgi:DinB superfamily